ncbi:hypothetical protein [Pseudobutyrivibrio xylanivorans]|uniref:Uncharacterized protein n=1 Tax=Pseudobutyrivibrio xylanivorans TaxID=185007 RepID=A0A1G5S079_PSEXY|nr:hypothetical protein [Pseudobutyrivibrio xylanivorans]SCZ78989.1 hypothetical protein SAMN02910350_01577 [Pseudobutyrivibrio xylanivorans]
MSRTFMKGIVAAIIIVVANVGLFLFNNTFTHTFWISYTFMMMAALITAYVEVIYVNKKQILHAYEISAVTGFYFVVAFIAGLISIKVLWLIPARAFFLQFVIFALYLVAYLVVSMHGSHVNEQQATRTTDLMNFKYILDNMKSAASKMEYSHPQRKMVMHAYDSLASGQVASSEQVFDIENSITEAVEELKAAITGKDDEKVEKLCKRIEELSDERKSKLTARRPF